LIRPSGKRYRIGIQTVFKKSLVVRDGKGDSEDSLERNKGGREGKRSKKRGREEFPKDWSGKMHV